MDGGSPYRIERHGLVLSVIVVILLVGDWFFGKIFFKDVVFPKHAVGNLLRRRSLFQIYFNPEFSVDMTSAFTLLELPGWIFRDGVILNKYDLQIGEYDMIENTLQGWVLDKVPYWQYVQF